MLSSQRPSLTNLLTRVSSPLRLVGVKRGKRKQYYYCIEEVVAEGSDLVPLGFAHATAHDY
jgi:hypothetical protein